jgi:two-component system LytT family sensor kinase
MGENDHRSEPVFMHPAIFISAYVLVGIFFALNDWIFMRQWGYHLGAAITFSEWGVDFLLWGTLCWILWCFLGPSILRANIRSILTRYVPLGVASSIVVEMLWVFLFPKIPINRPHMGYWQRLAFNYEGDFPQCVVIYWSAFFLFRGIGYYQQYREKEKAEARLQVQLVTAKMAALRMQLNPHFLFNTMNSISSLMHFDIDAADSMLEQLSSLLRITLERGDVQLIPLREEIEFIEVYLSMQARRYAGRVQQTLSVDPELHDALVPAMFLQPVVENAFAHGLSKVEANGLLSIQVQRDGKQMNVCVLNSGIGMPQVAAKQADGHGVGLTNVRSRLKLHYGEGWSLSLVEVDPKHVQVTILLPIQFSERHSHQLAKYGA